MKAQYLTLGFVIAAAMLMTLLVEAAKGVDLPSHFSNFSCLRSLGYSHTIVRSYHSYGAIDTQAPFTIAQSNAAGFSTDTYMFPCRGKNATTQVNELVNYLESLLETKDSSSIYDYTTGTIWLDIETNPSSGCSWTLGTPESNCDYIQELITAIESRGRAVGIYASGYMWNQIMGNRDNCQKYAKYPLWYAHYDGKANFEDWPTNKFGGWTNPTIKQYSGGTVLCGYNFDLSFF